MAGGHGSKLYVQIAEQIRSKIQEGIYQPGHRLPPLAHLAEQFECSRATVREALGALRGQGLVEFRHGNGTYVRTATVEMWMEPLEAAILLGMNQLKSMVELQTGLIAAIVNFAAIRNAEIDFSEVTQALFQLECSEAGTEEAVATELGFYMALAACCQNEIMDNALRVVQEVLRSSFRVVGRTTKSGIHTCRALYDHILAGNSKEARDLVYAYGMVVQQAIEESRKQAASN